MSGFVEEEAEDDDADTKEDGVEAEAVDEDDGSSFSR